MIVCKWCDEEMCKDISFDQDRNDIWHKMKMKSTWIVCDRTRISKVLESITWYKNIRVRNASIHFSPVTSQINLEKKMSSKNKHEDDEVEILFFEEDLVRMSERMIHQLMKFFFDARQIKKGDISHQLSTIPINDLSDWSSYPWLLRVLNSWSSSSYVWSMRLTGEN